jgi:hypothetical protein
VADWRSVSGLGLAALLLALNAGAAPVETRFASVSGEVLFDRYPADGTSRVLWLSGERGNSSPERRAAARLASRGSEVWQFDLPAAYFLDVGADILHAIPVEDGGRLLQRAADRSLDVFAIGRAAAWWLAVLDAAPSRSGPVCVILLQPNLYADQGVFAQPAFLAYRNLSAARIVLFQPRRAAVYPWLGEEVAALRQAGAKVELQVLEGVREAYWTRPDASEAESRRGPGLDQLFEQGKQLCASMH